MQEVVKLRTENSKTFTLPNGKYRLVIGGGNQHWRLNPFDTDEEWKECDLNWEGNRIIKAPYDLAVNGKKVTFKDKKEDRTSTLELLTSSCANEAQLGQTKQPVYEIVPFRDGIAFQHTITGSNLPFMAKFKVEGKVPRTRAYDDEGPLALQVSFDERTGILTERLTEIRDAESKKIRQAMGTIRIDPSLTVQPCGQDTYIESVYPARNYGAEEWLSVYDRATGHDRILVSLGIQALPEGAFIDAASLELDYYLRWAPGAAPTGKELYACKLMREIWEWQEGTGTAAAPATDGATWNDFREDFPWETAGGEFLLSLPPHAVAIVPAAYAWITWDVLHIVRDAHDNDIAANFLVKFATENEDPDRSWLRFRSKEYAADPTRQPRLVIDYSRLVIGNPTTDLTETAARLQGETLEETVLPVVVEYYGFVWGTRRLSNPCLEYWGDDFEWGFEGTDVTESPGQIQWTKTAGGNSQVQITTAQYVCGWRALRVYRDGGTARATMPHTAGSGYDITFDVRTPNNTAPYIAHGNPTVGKRIRVFANQHGTLRYHDGAGMVDTGYPVNLNQWHEVSIRNIDWAAGTYDLFCDGNFAANAVMDAASDWPANQIMLDIQVDPGTVYLDNLVITRNVVQPPNLQGLYPSFHVSALGAYNQQPFHHDTIAPLDTGRGYYVRAAAMIDGDWYYSKQVLFGTPVNVATYIGMDRVTNLFALYSSVNPNMVHFEGAVHRRTFISIQDEIIERMYPPLCGDPKGRGAQPHIIYYDWGTNTWHGPFRAGFNPIAGDLHSSHALFIDENDNMHMFFGSHGPLGNQQWTRSTRSMDAANPFTGVDDFEPQTSFGTSVTYPQVVGIINGRLVVLLRGESAGGWSRYESWWESADYAGAWPGTFNKTSTFIDGGDDLTGVCYLTYRPVVDVFGNVHVAWHWWDGTVPVPWHAGRYHTLYAMYDVAHSRWEKADGTILAIPITQATADLVTTQAGSSGPRLDVDETGRPYIIAWGQLHVWETTQWVHRRMPISSPVLEVVSSDLLYIYGYVSVGGVNYFRRYTSTNRGVSFHGSVTLAQWDRELYVQDLARASGTLPTIICQPVFDHQNPMHPNDIGSGYYQVGQLWSIHGTPVNPPYTGRIGSSIPGKLAEAGLI